MAKIECYLKENDSNVLRFPITLSEVGVSGSSNLVSDKINGLGSVNLFGGSNLKTTELSGFFPNKAYSFCNYTNFKKPYEFVRMLEKWMYSGTKLRYIVTDTHTNIQVRISSFTYREQDSTRDVYFEISLTEYRDIKVTNTENNNTTSSGTSTPDRPTENNPSTESKSHKVVKGDCLWDIAQRYYGKGSLYPKLVEKNKAKYPSLAKNNIIYVGWELEL